MNKNFNNVPQELKEREQWVVWRYKNRDDGKKPAKIPFNPTDKEPADVSNPDTWSSLETAFSAYQYSLTSNNPFNGIGFVISEDDPYAGIDCDNCRKPGNGAITEFVSSLINRFGSYTEVTPSGSGIRIYIKGSKGEIKNCKKSHLPSFGDTDDGEIEIYDRDRFFTVTGNTIDDTYKGIMERQSELDSLLSELFGEAKERMTKENRQLQTKLSDDRIIELASLASNKEKFTRLMSGDTSGYSSESEADMALCGILAVYTQDEEQILRIIKRSGLYDSKWERDDYIRRTIGKAIYNNPEKSAMSFRLTDIGNAERLVYHYGKDIRYCYAMKSWLIWNGKYWQTDDGDKIRRMAKDTVRKIYSEAGQCDDENIRKNIAEHAKKSESANKIAGMISLAQHEEGIPVLPEDMDSNNWLLNCQNGTIDLHTGKLLPYRREDLITKIIPVYFQPDTDCPRWKQFLNEIFNGDDELIKFVQVALGYSLTSSTEEQCFFICYGTGKNGKSTFLDVIEHIMGNYGRRVAPQTFEEIKRHGNEASEDIVRLKGSRFISTIETAQGRRIAENLIKQMTGDSKITARALYQESITFNQTYKIWFATNYKPYIRGTDEGMWRRIRLIPFEVTFPEEDQDKHLLEKLIDEEPGILNWMIEGCMIWQETGLWSVTPEKVKFATQQYRREMDTLQTFMDECCIIQRTAKIGSSELYKAYLNWCQCSGEMPESHRAFSLRMKNNGFDNKRATGGKATWHGIGLSDYKYSSPEFSISSEGL